MLCIQGMKEMIIFDMNRKEKGGNDYNYTITCDNLLNRERERENKELITISII